VMSEAGKNLGGEKAMKPAEKWTKEDLSSYKWLRGVIEVVKEIPKIANWGSSQTSTAR